MRRIWFFLFSACALLEAQTNLKFTISTVTGNGTNGFTGDGSAAASAEVGGPFGVAVDGSNNVYIADQYNNRVRKISNGTISTVAGSGVNSYSGDGKAATAATLSAPSAVAVDAMGNLYIADSSNYVIRKVTSNGNISTVVGVQTQGPGYAGDGALAINAVLSHPAAIAFDTAGNLYIADSGNNVVRVVSMAGNISSVAGYGVLGFFGDGGSAGSARLNNPTGLAIDRAGNLYIADTGNNRIRKVSGGIITTIAGTGVSGHAGDGGLATQAQLSNPKGLAIDAAGNLYVSDSFSSRIRVIGTNNIISTIAGNGTTGFSGDGGPATAAQLFFPAGLALGNSGQLYIADTLNNAVRLLTPVSGIPAIAPGGISAAAAFGGGTNVSPGDWIEIYGTQLAASSRGWGNSDFNGSSAPTSLDGVSVSVGGQAAFVDYISASQVNALLPSNVGTGQQQLTVTTPSGISASYTLNVNPVQPGLLAPASLNVNGVAYAGALFTDGATYALPAGAVSGVPSRPAKAGDTVTFYGIGFGAVTPAIAAGQIARQTNTLAMPVSVTIGGVPATVSYSGLAPGAVGLYQFNVVVPSAAAGNAVPVIFSLGGNAVPQTVYIAIGS